MDPKLKRWVVPHHVMTQRSKNGREYIIGLDEHGNKTLARFVPMHKIEGAGLKDVWHKITGFFHRVSPYIMPILKLYQYGNHGKKYRFDVRYPMSQIIARREAGRQAAAIHASENAD